MEIGAKLRLLRTEHSLTQRRLAELTGISAGYITMIENGQRTEVSGKILDRLAAAFGVQPDYFRTRMPVVPQEFLSGLPADIAAMMTAPDSRPYLELCHRAKMAGLSPAVLEKIIDLAIALQNKPAAKPPDAPGAVPPDLDFMTLF